ncbi:4-hydroxybenzoate polyprenyltransferase [Amycolatopsis rhizosphaerae]|uniref:4-hydroxybenzoate polyprenyltransferase n=1 Tax=Amycolatopsis rhizosphaerae TaxID=2053003 RepID=A0A558CJG6_9PSEU|nr:UbiA family prenyltransferase [Amycolatopsis rhizosphaerae]TVT48884.1 4-hydroxybenzoate polyprenyltransferase [Amycolatopsis rhizosphaerae]
MRALAELVRAPAALTVPGDTLAGAAAAGWPFRRRTLPLAAASVCLYWAGMALNDYADRGTDAVERPGRPIPSGRVSPATALALATGLTFGGLGIAAAGGGRRALRIAVPLAATVWSYDLVLKATPLGPVAMAAARGLDVLLGAGGARAAVRPACTVGAHTLAVSVLSRSEVDGARPVVPAAAMAATAGVTLAARGAGKVAPVLVGAYALTTGKAQFDAVRDPAAHRVRHAVGSGIHGMIPLQAGLIARTGAWRTALAVAAAYPLARFLGRKVSPT